MQQYQIKMFESQRQIYEYQLCLLSVKMKVKFPCRMKIEHMGSLVTGESPPSEDNRFIFNQQLILKDETQRDCFELTVNLLTDKGAKYIAAVIKLYKAELIRSQGERLVLSLSKCIDSEAFCEVKVDQVTAIKTGKGFAPYDRKSVLQRELPYRKETQDIQLSPYRTNPAKILESKSEYQFPLNNNGFKHDWETKSKSRLLPPQTAYQKSKLTPRINYAVQDPVQYGGLQLGQSVVGGREKALEAEVYKQGYQKLKEKYKKEAENSKMELNKRLALQNTQNNLKLEIMRLKLKSDQQEKSLAEKHSKLKEQQTQISLLQQKQVDNGYLREEISKKDANIKMLEDKVRSLTRSVEDMRDMATDRSNQQASRIRDLQVQMESLKAKLENKEKQFQKDSKAKQQLLHVKEIQLISKRDQLDRERKTVADLEKALQNKGFQLEKLLQNQRNNNKFKIDEFKSKIEKLQRDILKLQEEKKDQLREMEQLKSNTIKIEYDKKILTQQLDSIRIELNQSRNFREKYNESQRDNKSLIEQKNYLERQLEKAIQSKEYNLSQINKQFQDQVQYYKRINRQLDQKNKSISNRLIEVEGQLELSRSQQDKLRRNLQSTVKEAAQAKEKEKVARKALKTKEQESLSIESQQATMKQKLKSIQQICKLQVDKVREESEKIRIQLENQIDRVEELTQSNTKLTMEVNRLKIKLQYSQQKNEKDTANIKEKQTHIQTLIKDYQQQVSTLDLTINNLRLVQKEQSTKIQRYEIQAIKAEEKNQKSKKQIKILQERCNNLDNTIKAKITENQALLIQRDSLSKKLLQSQTEYNNLKSESLNLTNQRNKLQKMNELLQQQIKKAKNDNNNLASIISDKQKSEQQLRNVIKQQKEEYAKLDSKFNTYKKQTDRYRDTLNDTIQKTICNLPLSGKQEARKSFEDLLAKKSSSESNFNDIINTIISQSKQIRQALTKQTQQIKQMLRQNERLQEEASVSSNKYQNGEATLKRQLQQLQQQIEQVLAQKQTESGNYANIISQLDERVKSLQIIEQELNTQIQQLNFTINSLKMDNEAMNDQNSKKINNLKKLNSQLQEKVQYQLMTITELDERCSLMQADIDNLQTTIENEMQASHKKDKIIEQLRQIKENQQRALDQMKKQRKELSQRVSELELHLNTEREHKDKTKVLLEEQQLKANELKTFISNLMKQKQAAIKSQLQRSQKLIELEGLYIQINKQLQLLKEENERNFKAFQQQKEQNKKLTATIKEGDNERKQQRAKHLKTQEKLRQKQKQLLNKEDLLKKLEVRNEKTIEKYKSQIKEIQQQLQIKNNNNLEVSKDTNQKIISLQAQVQKKTSQIISLEAKLAQLEQQLFAQRQSFIIIQQNLTKSKAQNEELRLKIVQLDNNLNQITEESKEKEQKLFEFSGKIYNLELKIQTKQKERSEHLQNFDQEWINKYDSMCQQYEQRLELVEKERDYFRGLCDQKDREISKINHAIKIAEANQTSLRRTNQQKIKRLEQQKLALFSQKNNQIQILVQQAKSSSDILRQKQAQLRRLTNELEVARKTILNLDAKSKQYDEKIKGINKVYQTQLEQLKKKDTNNKAYRQSVNTHQWNVQREVKKSLQNFIKNFLQVSDDKNSQKLIELVRSLEKGIMEILSAKPVDK